LTASVPFKKKIAFYSIAVCIPVIFLILLEIGLRVVGVGDDLRLFTQANDAGYLRINPVVAKRYFSKFGFTTPLNDQFLEKKSKNCYRIFILGESTVMGFPYDANISFSRILQYRLQDVFPEKRIEMINTGLTAVNSYTLLDFIDEILQQEPDAILIYAGHNEFYGALGVASVESGGNYRWLKMTHLMLIRFRIYQLMRNFVAWIGRLVHPTSLDEAKGTLMQKIMGGNLIEYGSAECNEGIDQFQVNMRRLLLKAESAGVPVIVSELVSNIRDMKPFGSITAGKNPPAIDVYQAAQKAERDADFVKARDEYYRAKDLDAIKFRAPEDINAVIHELGEEFNLPVVSMKEYFEAYSKHRLIGDNLMAEHLHPNIDGYFIMSQGFLDAMREYKFIDTTWSSRSVHDWRYYRNSWGYTELDSLVADLRIQHLKAGWPFQPPETINNFRFTYEPHGFVDSLAFLTLKYNDITTAQTHQNLGTVYSSRGDYYKAFKEYYALVMTYPFTKSYYYKSAQYLDLAKDCKTEVKIFQSMPDYETDPYALFQCGKIFLDLEELGRSIRCLEQARRTNADLENVLPILKTLFVAYKDSGLTRQCDEIFGEIKKYEPFFSLEKARSSIFVLLPEEVKPYIERGKRLISEGKLNDAEQVLQQSLRIKETAYANLLLGGLLVQQRRIEALPYLEKAYVEIKDDPALLNKLCVLYMVKGDYKKAMAKVEEIKKVVGKNDPKVKELERMVQNSMRAQR
jgi:tetratricopeptide (TPR) repeat protein